MIVLEPRRREATPVLATARLVLRAPAAADAQALSALVNDRRIAENTARIPHPYSLAQAQAFIAQANLLAHAPSFLISRADGKLIGGCGIAAGNGADLEIGYWIGVPHWGSGYATEAARALIDHVFGTLGCEQLAAGARVTNPASRRVLEKCGFRWCGVGLLRIRALGFSVPIDRFRLDRGLWASLKRPGRMDKGGPDLGNA